MNQSAENKNIPDDPTRKNEDPPGGYDDNGNPRTIVKNLPDGRKIALSEAELNSYVEEKLKADYSTVKQETEKKEPEKEKEKKELTVEEVDAKIERMKQEQANKERNAALERKQEKLSQELSEAINRYENIAENKKLSGMIQDHVIAERYRGVNKPIDKLVEEAISNITEGKTQANREYIEQKKKTAKETRGVSGMGEGTGPAADEIEPATMKDLKSGNLKKRTRERLAAAREQRSQGNTAKKSGFV
jgi:hypothetical protein